MNSFIETDNTSLWADFWSDGTREGKNRGPMVADFRNQISWRYEQDQDAGREATRLSRFYTMLETY